MITILNKRLEEAREARVGVLVRGNASDYSNYREQVGFLKGLEYAQSLVDDLARDLENFDD